MAAPMEEGFDGWLSRKLLKINADVDLDVFVQYIRGILETETDNEEKNESIVGILAEITENDLEKHCEEIHDSWYRMEAKEEEERKLEAEKGKLSFDEKMHDIMEKQTQQVVKSKEKSATSNAAKQAILAQYAQVSDGEVTDDGEEGGADGDDLMFAKNFNSQMVIQKQQAEREKSKSDHDKKKAKDKEDREKQKQKAIDRKEAEKKRTQKGEKRR